MLALLALSGLGHWNMFAVQCVGLGSLCVFTLWVFHKMQKEDFVYRRPGWALGIVYFAIVIAAVARFFDSLGMTLLFAAPEIAGIAVSVVGFVDSRTPSALAKNEE